jgi:hypothetical protein
MRHGGPSYTHDSAMSELHPNPLNPLECIEDRSTDLVSARVNKGCHIHHEHSAKLTRPSSSLSVGVALAKLYFRLIWGPGGHIL